jgi:hypothetical protein
MVNHALLSYCRVTHLVSRAMWVVLEGLTWSVISCCPRGTYLVSHALLF